MLQRLNKITTPLFFLVLCSGTLPLQAMKKRQTLKHFYELNGGTITQRTDEEKIDTKKFNLKNGIKLSFAQSNHMHPIYGNVLTQLGLELYGPYVKRSILFFADGTHGQHAESILQLYSRALRLGGSKYLQLKAARGPQVGTCQQFKMIPRALLYTGKGGKNSWSFRKNYFLFYGLLPLDMNQCGFKFTDNQILEEFIQLTILRFYNFGWEGKINAYVPASDQENGKTLTSLGFSKVFHPTASIHHRYTLPKKSYLRICTNSELPRKKEKAKEEIK